MKNKTNHEPIVTRPPLDLNHMLEMVRWIRLKLNAEQMERERKRKNG